MTPFFLLSYYWLSLHSYTQAAWICSKCPSFESSFFPSKFFTSRITAKGLYLIDEPEAALSPVRQLSLLSLIKQKVKETGAHFIIATHSPIIMSAPDSEVFYFQDDTITKVDYKETEHYQLTKSILDNPDLVMREL